MADARIHSVVDKLVLRSYFQTDRPVVAKIDVRAAEQPKPRQQARGAQGEGDSMERVVCKRQQWSDYRNQWKNCRGYPHEREERDFPAPFLALYDLEFGAPFSVGNPDRDHCDQTYQELHSAKPGVHDVSANRLDCGVRHSRLQP